MKKTTDKIHRDLVNLGERMGFVARREVTDSLLALLRLRAVEHRIAACALAGSFKEAIKTDNYKHIQRLPSRDGVFGLNAHNLGGTHVTWSKRHPAGAVRAIPGVAVSEAREQCLRST